MNKLRTPRFARTWVVFALLALLSQGVWSGVLIEDNAVKEETTKSGCAEHMKHADHGNMVMDTPDAETLEKNNCCNADCFMEGCFMKACHSTAALILSPDIFIPAKSESVHFDETPLKVVRPIPIFYRPPIIG